MKHCPNPDCSHLAETGRAGEYRDVIAVCSDCGVALAPGEPPEIERPGQLRWTAVEVVPDPHAAHLVKSALAMEGIPSELRRVRADGEALTPGRPTAAEVMVPEHLAEAAIEILRGRPAEPVGLPDDENLEFVDAGGARIEMEPPGSSDVEFADAGRAEMEMDRPHAGAPPATDSPSGGPSTGAKAARPLAGRGFGASPSTEEDWPPCPRCGSSSITHAPPDSPAEARGFFKRIFSSPPRWICLACQHRW